MKKFLLLFIIITPSVYAETSEEAINNACLKQAVSLAQKLKADMFTTMDSEQTDNVIRLSTESCKQQFAAKETKQTLSQSEEEDEKSSGGDWFTQMILSGETPDKAGNKRLKRLQSK